jgi:PP-loop superfamily ATP-utilizing enzyme
MKLASQTSSEVMCIFVETKYTSPSDLKGVENEKYSEETNPPIKILERPDLSKNILILNPKDRDFFCKKSIADILEEQRISLDYDIILDGISSENYRTFLDGKNPFGENYRMIFGDLDINSDDLLNIAGNLSLNFTRSHEINLLTRFPIYDIPITEELLNIVSRSESFITDMVGKDVLVRLRVIKSNQVIIELDKKYLGKILDEKSRRQIYDRLSNFGFESICIDLAGYQKSNIYHTMQNF